MAYVGSQITFSMKFTDSDGDADPDVVRFLLREEVDGTELEWTYTTSGGATTSPTGFSSTIVRDSEGDFHLNHTARKPERHTGTWTGSGTVFQTSQSTVFVRHSGNSLLDVY